MEQEKFDLWCIVELFGHSKIAGRCTEQNVAGTNMLRVDVPETRNQPSFTRFLSSGAIYAINPTTEEVAKTVAAGLEISPVSVWDIKPLIESKMQALQQSNTGDYNDGDDNDADADDPITWN